MFKNHFKIAWRNLLRNKTNSFINIGGLAIGITCVIFIVLYVQDELNYDRGFKQADNIYQVNLDANFGGQVYNTSFTPPPVAISLQKEFPEIKAYTRLYSIGNTVVHHSATAGDGAGPSFTEKRIRGVDSNFLQVFDYQMIAGDPAACLKKNYSLVLTETTARKYFGHQQALGQLLALDGYPNPFVVTGILKDLPSNTSLQAGGWRGSEDDQ